MSECSWYDAFEKRMNALGAPVPGGFFDTYDKALTTVGALVAAANLNPGISAAAALSVAEVGAGGVIVTLSAIGAAGYAGLAAGSMMMAAIDNSICITASKRATPQSVSAFLRSNGIYDTLLVEAEIMRNPRIMALS
ncbi:hypothetical protein [Ketobacter sp. GenoA1]|jgi:hypothetical protein|uniref:hypothetical protein n=1 Tax=Ketobacter sp. GenoA1 TaxID=2072747 RepID=UPI000F1EF28A|nr:hypothetical protein [Ketobacter sp. GenoA1]RLT89655.1 MAG: hypothetical protein D9N13_11805 [Ketobacter sp. GenoA1]|tara:strand:- start:184 stop:594 length:411 start_codon:yes stop_codon:yes gene_type:complete